MPHGAHFGAMARTLLRPRSLPWYWRYAAAPAATLVAFVAHRLIVPQPTVAPFALFFAAIAAASWVGGRGPGILTTALSAFAGSYFFGASAYSVPLTGGPYRSTALFIVAGSVVALVCGSLRAAMLLGEERAALLQARELELEKAAEAVRQSEQKYRRLVEMTQTGFVILDAGGKVVDANAEYVRLTGHQRLAEILGRSVLEWTADFDRARNAQDVKRCLETGSVRGLEVSYVDREGLVTPVEIDATVFRAEDGDRILALCRDVSERRRLADQIRCSEAKYRGLVEQAIVGIGLSRGDEVVFANRALLEMLGYDDLDEFQAVPVLEHVDPSSRDRMLAVRERRARGEPAEPRVECRVRRRDGTTRDVELAASTVTIDGEQLTQTVFKDITERARAEETALRSQAVLAQAGEMANLGAWWIEYSNLDDLNDNPLHWSPQTFRIFGYKPGELDVSIPFFFQRVHPDDRARIESAVARALATRTPYSLEHRIIRLDGTERVVWEHGEGVFDEQGRPRRLVGAVQDITERKRVEEALRERESQLQAIFENAPMSMAIATQDGKIEYFNRKAVATFGYSLKEVPTVAEWWVRAYPAEGYRREVVDTWTKLVEKALRTHGKGEHREIERREYRVTCKDGTVRTMLIFGVIVAEKLFVMFDDVTERRRAEDAAREADRRKSEFLGVLSHELRNPLSPIRNSLFILDRATPGGAQARRALEVIDRQVSHLTRLVDDLLDVTRISRGKIRLQRARMDLAEVIRGTLEDHRAVLEGRDVAIELPEEAVWVDGDPTRLAQVVGNLLTNAVKFTPEIGSISVSLGTTDGQAVLVVSDTGIGIDPETLERLFEPFAQADRSLDRSRGGLGLGLALVKGLVELHGGEVSAHSEGAGRGARFTVTVPVAGQGEATRRSSVVPPPAAKGRRVLVIEDNADAAESLREALMLAGHKVAVAYDGDSGMRKAGAFRPDVILCDIGLPGGMDGYAVARALRQDPSTSSTRLVALTGYAQQEDRQRARDAGFDAHLAKPPSLPALERLLAEATPGFEVQPET